MSDDRPMYGAGDVTPIQWVGDTYFVKRDDLFKVGGVRGGKARACWWLAMGARGLVTVGHHGSPQIEIVARIAKHLGIPCRCHTPTGNLWPEELRAKAMGMEIIQHKMGFTTVLSARARADAHERGWKLVPFGMECNAAVDQTASQVRDIPQGVKRVVVTCGSGMSLAGILRGMDQRRIKLPVLGVMSGANPYGRLDRYAPFGWRTYTQLVPSGVPYKTKVECVWHGIRLDPIYEAKCVPFLLPGDLFWIVGIRNLEPTDED